ncbi:MAG: hypothetical protein ACKOVA_15805 [Novosphingobium sp.]
MEGGRVGFHAAYRDKQGKLEEVGSANALIGSYLTSLGLPTKAVLFTTSAPPDAILWLTDENRRSSGIDYTQSVAASPAIQTQPVMPFTPAPHTARPIQPPQTSPKSSGDLIASLSRSGERWTKIEGFLNAFYDQSSAIIPKKGWRKFWILYDYSAQLNADSLYEMQFAEIKCGEGALRLERILLGYADGNTKERVGLGYHVPAPGTEKRALVVRLCGIR